MFSLIPSLSVKILFIHSKVYHWIILNLHRRTNQQQARITRRIAKNQVLQKIWIRLLVVLVKKIQAYFCLELLERYFTVNVCTVFFYHNSFLFLTIGKFMQRLSTRLAVHYWEAIQPLHRDNNYTSLLSILCYNLFYYFILFLFETFFLGP